MQWFKVILYRAHYGIGKKQETVVYIYAQNPIKVCWRIKLIGGIKRNKFLEIVPICEDEASELENTIVRENFISLKKAKHTWYFPENK